MLSSLRSFLLLGILQADAAPRSAWNGYKPDIISPSSAFTPFYVPPGATAYHAPSHYIKTSGTWHHSYPQYYNASAIATTAINASLTFLFSGSAVELYGPLGNSFGEADVFLDGSLYKSYSAYSRIPREQQLLFFAYDLKYAPHTLKVVNRGSNRGSHLEIVAFVVTKVGTFSLDNLPLSPVAANARTHDLVSSPPLVSAAASVSHWSLIQRGSTGVAAMQLAVISASHAIIIDKVEHNPLTIDGHPAWGALYNLDTHSVKPLNMKSNSFCAGGAFLSNGTLINVGGNPVVLDGASAADFGDVDGLQSVRLFHPCEPGTASQCDIYENHARIRMASPRWYNTVLRISDGSAMIIGGSKKGGWINNATTNNPTIEFYPPKNIHGSNGLPVHLPFLVDTLNSNLFPIAFALPDDKIFVAANGDAMIYDWRANNERRLPKLPNHVRVTYPMTGTGLLLPLSLGNSYAPEILLCGGSTLDDTRPGYTMSSQDLASTQCSRMVLTDEGIAAGWQVEHMPQARIMPDAVLLPTGDVLIVNGGENGISGYGNVKGQVGQSNADKPTYVPVLYTPNAAAGSRFSNVGLPSSQIPRLYHSTATLTPKGDVMMAGSNPNLDRSEEHYGTEYRVEWLSPPYMSAERPSLLEPPHMINFGETVTIPVRLPSSASTTPHIEVACMDLGYVTHSVHANTRLVYLVNQLEERDGKMTLLVTGPPNGKVYPPGPAWIYVVVDGVPSVGAQIVIGDGSGPEVDQEALENVLRQPLAT